jgi:hypothetical protein
MPLPASRRCSQAPRMTVFAGPLAGVVAIMIVLAACGSASSASAGAGDERAGQPPAAASSDPGKGLDVGNGDGQGSVPLTNLADREIVRTGEVTLEVPAVGAAVGELRAMAITLDGYVSDSRTGGEHDAATVTLRVPADRFDEALTRLHGMKGEVRVEATKDEDVTSSIVDLEARIQNLQASEEQYRVLVGRAEKINDVLAVQSRLDQVRGEIEQLSAQLKQLNGLAALSTLTVTLVPASTPVEDATEAWDPGSTFGNAVAALVSAGQALADVAIWLLIVGLPVLVISAILLWVAMRFGPVARRFARAAPAGDE